MQKILHVITGLNDGGAEGVLARLCLNCKRAKHVVISLTDAGKYGETLTAADITVRCLGMNPGRPSLFKFLALVRLIKMEQPDVIQTWMYHSDLLGGIAARMAGVKRVFWGIRMSSLEKGKCKRSTILISRVCAALSSWLPEKIVCCANKALDAHVKIGYAASKMVVIRNGYDLSCFRPDVKAGAALRALLKLDAKEFVIGKVGRFDPMKDHFNLLQALALVAQKGFHFKCLLVGKNLTPDNHILMRRMTELGLQDYVVLLGARSDIPAIMNALSLHVLSSSSEGFPNVIAEAMACGTPCVSTDVGDAMEIIGDSKACCPAHNSQALAELIIKMATEQQQCPEAWEARKSFSAKRIADNFSIQGMVEAYEACWFSRSRSLK